MQRARTTLWPNITACLFPVCLSHRSPLSFIPVSLQTEPFPARCNACPRTCPLLVLGTLGWMKRRLGWHLVCPGHWQGLAGQDQPGPGSAEGKKSFLAASLGSSWLRGCSPLPLHLARNRARKRSSLGGEPRCSQPISAAFPGAHYLLAKHRARLCNDLFAENQQALPRHPPAPSHGLLPEPPSSEVPASARAAGTHSSLCRGC